MVPNEKRSMHLTYDVHPSSRISPTGEALSSLDCVSDACSFAATSCLGHVLQAHVALAAQVWLQCYALEIYKLGHAILFYLCPTGLRQGLKTGVSIFGSRNKAFQTQVSILQMSIVQ